MMSFTEDFTLVMTMLLGVLMIGYGVLLGAVVLWIGRQEAGMSEPRMVRPAAESELRKAA
jgi:hypothetical protein